MFVQTQQQKKPKKNKKKKKQLRTETQIPTDSHSLTASRAKFFLFLFFLFFFALVLLLLFFFALLLLLSSFATTQQAKPSCLGNCPPCPVGDTTKNATQSPQFPRCTSKDNPSICFPFWSPLPLSESFECARACVLVCCALSAPVSKETRREKKMDASKDSPMGDELFRRTVKIVSVVALYW